MTEQTAAIPPETLAALLTAPVELEQALKLKDCYDRLTAAAAPPASESARICDAVCRTLVDASPPEFARMNRTQMENFRKWQLKGQRRKLIEAFRAEANLAERQAGPGSAED